MYSKHTVSSILWHCSVPKKRRSACAVYKSENFFYSFNNKVENLIQTSGCLYRFSTKKVLLLLVFYGKLCLVTAKNFTVEKQNKWQEIDQDTE